MKIIHRSDAIHTPRTRDEALRRLRRANRWLIAGSAVLTGVLTDVAANAFAGHTRTTSSRAGTGSHTAHKQLQPPKAAPKPTTTQQAAPPSSESSEAPPTERSEATPPEQSETPPAETPAPAQEAAPEPAPAEEAPRVEAPAPPEEPVVSGGS